MEGKKILRHPDKDQIDSMFQEGYSAEEILNWIKVKRKHRMYWPSVASLNSYRQNFLNITTEQLKQKRQQLLDSGSKDKQGIDAIALQITNNELREIKEKAKTDVIKIMDNFKFIQDKIKERLEIVEKGSIGPDGTVIFKARNEEVFEKYLGRLESLMSTYQKVSDQIEKKASLNAPTEISITTEKINQYSDIYKTIMQKILTRLDPGLLSEFLDIYQEEMGKANSGSSEQVKISINNGQNLAGKINITTNIGETQSPKIEPANVIDVENEE